MLNSITISFRLGFGYEPLVIFILKHLQHPVYVRTIEVVSLDRFRSYYWCDKSIITILADLCDLKIKQPK